VAATLTPTVVVAVAVQALVGVVSILLGAIVVAGTQQIRIVFAKGFIQQLRYSFTLKYHALAVTCDYGSDYQPRKGCFLGATLPCIIGLVFDKQTYIS
jgi:hypothetical protein